MITEFCYDDKQRMQDLKMDILNFEVGLVNIDR